MQSKLSPIVDRIIKIRRVKLLVERLLLEGSLGAWSGSFVVGPDGKYIRLPGGAFHGDAVLGYPKYKAAAEEYFGGKSELDRAARAGDEDLYRLMASWGFIRGGGGRFTDAWISIDPKKVSDKACMTVLRLAKENDMKDFDIENVTNYKYERDVEIDDFIERFL